VTKNILNPDIYIWRKSHYKKKVKLRGGLLPEAEIVKDFKISLEWRTKVNKT